MAGEDEARRAEVEVVEEARAGEGESLLELILEEHAARAPAPRIDGVLVGTIAAVDPEGGIRVTFPGAPEGGVAARAMASLGPDDAGREVALLFEGGDPARPVVMGKMATPAAARPDVKTDGDRLELRAEKEIVLSCGEASITLTRAGKILIRGAYVLSRSSGVNRIQGGAVEIN